MKIKWYDTFKLIKNIKIETTLEYRTTFSMRHFFIATIPSEYNFITDIRTTDSEQDNVFNNAEKWYIIIIS